MNEKEQKYQLYLEKNRKKLEEKDSKIEQFNNEIKKNKEIKAIYRNIYNLRMQKTRSFQKSLVLLITWLLLTIVLLTAGIGSVMIDIMGYLFVSVLTCINCELKIKKSERDYELLKKSVPNFHIYDVSKMNIKKRVRIINERNKELRNRIDDIQKSSEEIENVMDLIEIYFSTKNELANVKNLINNNEVFDDFLVKEKEIEEKISTMPTLEEVARERVSPSNIHFDNRSFTLKLVNKNNK